MKRLLLPVIGLLAACALALAPAAIASSPHFVKDPTYSATTAPLTASGKRTRRRRRS
jgi:hypothetical protein